jgi:hypothetical protein
VGRFDPLSVVVGGRVIAGPEGAIGDPSDAVSMDWLDELYRGRS